MQYSNKGVDIVCTPKTLLLSPFMLYEYCIVMSVLHSTICTYCSHNTIRGSQKGDLLYTLVLSDDVSIAQYVQQYFGVDVPTNVLAFEAKMHEPKTVILSLETMQREACLYGQSHSEYTLFLLTHACIHAHGFDHGSIMDSLSDTCMKELEHLDFQSL